MSLWTISLIFIDIHFLKRYFKTKIAKQDQAFMRLSKINYDDLNSRQQEIYNFQKIAAVLADYGFNCIKLSDDWGGADFLAHHKDGSHTLKVQLKSRITIDKKYIGKEICLAFPTHESWYLIQHDELVDMVGKYTNWLNTDSWRIKGNYSSIKPGNLLLDGLSFYQLSYS